MLSRVERSALANWWWTIDRWLIAALGALIVFGLVLTMAASPPVAERLGLPTFHFVHKQVLFLVPAVAVFFATLVPFAAACAARRSYRLRRLHGADHRGAVVRR